MTTNSPRIVSFLPSATEIACALGLEQSLLGITHTPILAVRPRPVRLDASAPEVYAGMYNAGFAG